MPNKETIVKIGAAIAVAGTLVTGVYFEVTKDKTEYVEFVQFENIPINPETGGYDIRAVVARLDEWIIADEGNAKNKSLYNKYKEVRGQDSYTLAENNLRLEAFNAKMEEIKANCKEDKRCVKKPQVAKDKRNIMLPTKP